MKIAKIFFLILLFLTPFVCDAGRIITNKSGGPQQVRVTFHEWESAAGRNCIHPYSCELSDGESVDLNNIEIIMTVMKKNSAYGYTNRCINNSGFGNTKEIQIGNQTIYCSDDDYKITLDKNNKLKKR